MPSSIRRTLALCLLCLVATPLPAWAQTQIRIHGATTVTYGLLRPHKAEIEKATGLDLLILPSSTSRGLQDLVEGKADIAMLAEPLGSAAASLNSKKQGAIELPAFTEQHVGNAVLHIIVHPSNGVGKLSSDQLAGLFSGRIRNWSEVGGADIPVLLAGEPTSSPHKMIAEALGISYSADLRAVQNTNQTAIIVSQAPGALSYITSAHDPADLAKVRIVDSDLKLPIKLFLAYRKNPSEPIRKLVAAAAAIGNRQ